MLNVEQGSIEYSSWDHVYNLIRRKSALAEFNAFLGTHTKFILKKLNPDTIHLFNCWPDLANRKFDCSFVKECLNVKFREQIISGQIVIHDEWDEEENYDAVFYNLDNISCFEKDLHYVISSLKDKGVLFLQNVQLREQNRTAFNTMLKVTQQYPLVFKGSIEDCYVLQLNRLI